MTSTKVQLQATLRTILGRKVSSLRREAKIPANVYSKQKDSVAITLDKKEFVKLYSTAGETTLIDLNVDAEKKSRPVLIRDAQRHPVTGDIVHVDFQQVDLSQKVTANIPVETTGESEAVKAGGVLVVTHNEIEVEALPTDLPEVFSIDISKLNAMGDTITVADLQFDREKVTIELDPEEVLATIQAQEEEKVEEVTTELAEPELIKQGATKADEEAAADGSAPAKEEEKK